MATIEAYSTQRGRRYRVRYRTPDRRQTRRGGFTTKRDAELFAATVEVSKARGEYIDHSAGSITLGDLGAAWLDRQTHLKPSSLAPVQSAWRVHVAPRWSAVRLRDVTPTDVQAWVSDLSRGTAQTSRGGRPASGTTVHRVFGVLAAVLDDAVRDRRLLSNPARGTKLPRKGTRERVYLSHDQAHALADESGPHRTLVLVLVYCGLRWGEAIGLRVGHLDMLRRRLNVTENAVEVGSRVVVGTPKTHERRSVPFPAFLATELAQACEGKSRDDLVFPGPTGKHLRRPRTDPKSGSWFAGAVRRSGVPHLTPHDLRHTAASLAVSAGANVKAVQRMLGHASAAMTLDVYADLFDDDLDAVAGALDQAVRDSGLIRRSQP